MSTCISISFDRQAEPVYVAVAQLAAQHGKSVAAMIKVLLDEALAARNIQINRIGSVEQDQGENMGCTNCEST